MHARHRHVHRRGDLPRPLQRARVHHIIRFVALRHGLLLEREHRVPGVKIRVRPRQLQRAGFDLNQKPRLLREVDGTAAV